MRKRIFLKGKKRELIIKVDKKYYRPLEIDYLKGDPKKALRLLKYKLKHDLKALVKDMIDSDIEAAKKIMKKTDRIFIAGHNGLVGNAVVNILKKKKGYKNLILVNRKNLDLKKKFQ